jgi:hypothetical protein
MLTSKRSRLKEQLEAVEARIEQLRAQVENPLVAERPESAPNGEPSERQGQADQARVRADSIRILDRLAGPEGRKARNKTDLLLTGSGASRLSPYGDC